MPRSTQDGVANGLDGETAPGKNRSNPVGELRRSPGDGDGLTHGMGYGLQRFSTLAQINKDTVRRLMPRWAYALGDYRGPAGPARPHECRPGGDTDLREAAELGGRCRVALGGSGDARRRTAPDARAVARRLSRCAKVKTGRLRED